MVISKKVIALGAVDGFAFLQQREQRLFLDQLAGEADALVEAHEMGRDIGMHAIAGRLQHGAQIGDDGALAVGAGDMDDRRQAPFGMAEALQQPPDAVERQIDDLRMKPVQPLENQVAAAGCSL